MGASDSKSLQGLGFLTAIEDETQGWVGGLLVLNAASRPLEFHCTAPIKPSRAQQILYGATLAPYLCGEQIAAALTRKSNVPTIAYFTDVLAMLAVRPLVNTPVVFVDPDFTNTKNDGRQLRIDKPHNELSPPHANSFISFQVNESQMCASAAFPDDQCKVEQLLNSEITLNLLEPFERVQEALQETQLRKR